MWVQMENNFNNSKNVYLFKNVSIHIYTTLNANLFGGTPTPPKYHGFDGLST